MDGRRFDVVVIGDGPAGCTVALELSKSGYSVGILGLTRVCKRLIGETLPPDVKSRLIHLGIWRDFLNDGHLPSAGNAASWGDSQIRETNFIFHPDTNGWHVDRKKFDQMILNSAMRTGGIYLNTRIVTIEKNNTDIWKLKLKSHDTERAFSITACFLVDATGRWGVLSSRHHTRRVAFDNLIGFVSFLFSKDTKETDTTTFIEAVPDGWWYSALLPDRIRVISFFTDSNLPIIRYVMNYNGWKKMIEGTRYIGKFLENYKYHLISGPHARISNSSIMEEVTGQRWLAVGDASMTFDPISSQGILTAIDNSIMAADSIEAYFNNKTNHVEYYRKKLSTDFYRYLIKRNYFYNLENRWNKEPFWKHNQELDKQKVVHHIFKYINR